LAAAGGIGVDEIRARDRAKKNAAHAARSVIQIPDCADRERRARLEQDDVAWLRWYFGEGCGLDDPFTYEFTADQLEMLNAISHAIQYGGDQALAASRSDGKTTLAERRVLKTSLTGEVNYSVLFAASGQMAENSIDTLRNTIADNDRLCDDYPEVCIPVRELENTPQRANTQKASGNRHDNGQPYEMAALHYTWCGQELIFPMVPGSPSAGAIIATRGLDAAVRGLKKRGKRPKLAIIDDPDTEDSSRSEEQAKKLEKRIDAAIGGLGGQRRGIGRVMLTTIQSRISVSFKFTDPKQKPTFRGKRYRFLIAKPSRVDMWEEYVALRVQDLQQVDGDGKHTDEFCRRSHRFYLERREEMDEGAVVSNPNRFDDSPVPCAIGGDGAELMSSISSDDLAKNEVSALQAYYNLIAKLGPEVVATEYDNDPPEESAIVESGLAPTRIQKQLNGLGRRVIPNGATLLTQGIDVRKRALHWVVRAWTPDGSFHTIDYGIHEVVGTQYAVDEGVDVAVLNAICDRYEAMKDTEYLTEEGGRMPVDLTLVDAGWKTDAVYAACMKIGAGIMPVMGFGKSSGCTQANFHEQQRNSKDKKPGDGWFLSRRKALWLVCADTDRWKGWEHDRWMTKPGSLACGYMYGQQHDNPEYLSQDSKDHHAYARHICNESEVEEPHKGTIRRAWKAKSDNTHWLDASYYADVAANIRGVKTASSMAAQIPQKKDPTQRKSLAELAGRRA